MDAVYLFDAVIHYLDNNKVMFLQLGAGHIDSDRICV